MTDSSNSDQTWHYAAREAVGVFSDADALDAAVDTLESAGFDRASISVLASDRKIRDRIGHLYEKVAEAEDDPKAPLSAYVSNAERTEAKAAGVGLPMYVGGAAGAFAVLATGGVLAAAVAAAIAAGAAGAGLGMLLAHAIGKAHQDHVQAQLAQGGLILWVGIKDADAEARALAILTKAGAHDVHVHAIQREWTLKDIPFSGVQPDPLLGASA